RSSDLLGKLGHPVDQLGDVGPEVLLDLLDRDERVLDRVVEQRGDDRLLIELEVGHQPGDFDRVAEIGIAAGALLRAVLLHRVHIGTVQQRLVGVRIVGLYPFDEFVLTQHSSDVRCSIAGSKGKACATRQPTPPRRCPWLPRRLRSSSVPRCWRGSWGRSTSVRVSPTCRSPPNCSKRRGARWSRGPTSTRRCAAWPSCARPCADITAASRGSSWRPSRSSSPPARPRRWRRRSSRSSVPATRRSRSSPSTTPTFHWSNAPEGSCVRSRYGRPTGPCRSKTSRPRSDRTRGWWCSIRPTTRPGGWSTGPASKRSARCASGTGSSCCATRFGKE